MYVLHYLNNVSVYYDWSIISKSHDDACVPLAQHANCRLISLDLSAAKVNTAGVEALVTAIKVCKYPSNLIVWI